MNNEIKPAVTNPVGKPTVVAAQLLFVTHVALRTTQIRP
jgi:hypothetical protein